MTHEEPGDAGAVTHDELGTAVPREEHPTTPAAAVSEPRRRRLDSLDGLRACAAFGVFLFHINLLMPIPHTSVLFVMGSSGVSLFFVLSGYVLTWSSGVTPAGTVYRRRFARIFPLLALTTLLGVVVVLGGAWSTRDVLVSVFGIQAWLPDTFRVVMPNPVVWSLSCEAFFYLLLPWLVLLARRIPRSTLLTIAGLCVLCGWGLRAVLWSTRGGQDLTTWALSDTYLFWSYSPVARLPEFLLGVALAAAVKAGWRPRIPVRVAGSVLGGVIVLLWVWGQVGWSPQLWVEVAGHVMIPLFALVIVAAARRDESGGRGFLRRSPMVRLGWWSYAFYLVHFLVVFGIARIALDRTSVYALSPPSWGHVPYALMALVIAVGVSWLLYRVYERPLERLIRGRRQ